MKNGKRSGERRGWPIRTGTTARGAGAVTTAETEVGGGTKDLPGVEGPGAGRGTVATAAGHAQGAETDTGVTGTNPGLFFWPAVN